MNLLWSPDAWGDYSTFWCLPQHKKIKKRLDGLIQECMRTPYSGTGKPEQLKRNLMGWWSRRITDEHRLVYRVVGHAEDARLEVLSCRFHYTR